MVPIFVTAEFRPSGEIVPVDFRWQGSLYPVISTGRSWHDEKGFHILVMTPGEQVFELAFVVLEMTWYLANFGSHHV